MSTIITKRQFPHYHKYTMDLAGRPLTLEVGKLAELANAAVMVGYGDTRVLCCVTAAPRPRDGIDFFPLSVDFEEKMYAVGRIPGSFNRREGRPGEKGILTSRVIDRPIRPLFPYDFRNDVSVMCTVMAVDHDCSPEIAALIGTSAALAISDIPWNGPVAALKVGLVDGKLVFNPDAEQRKVSDLDVTVVSTGKKVVMIEAGANEVPNDVMFEAIKQAHEENQKQIALINQMVQEIGKPKFEYPHADFNYELFNKITADFMDEAKAAMDTDDKNVREQRWNAMIEKWHEKYLEEYPNMDQYLEEITYKFQKMIVKKWLLEGHRVDGRQKNEIRPLDAEVGVLPRVHGSGLFTRGQTQVLSVCTLDTLSANQKLDTIWEETEKRYMHHYNFPGYSVGEAKPARSPGRREIGHGALAERALLPVIPPVEEFPYAIRVVSEVVSSNGSTSQGSICGSTLALMDAGVPIKAPVAGISCGLIQDDNGAQQFVVDLEFNDEGRELFGEATSRLVGQTISIWMDDVMISQATVKEAITEGKCNISGNFTSSEAAALASKIQAGALPFKLETTNLRTINPTLGASALNAMALAGAIALVLVCLFMLIVYRVPGFVACIALLGQVALSLACVSGFFNFVPSFTLTLPGIAGVILSIGMGVDANIITNERIKEELRAGKTLDGAIRTGSKTSFAAIFDGNITVIIVAVILMLVFGPSNILSGIFGASTTGTIYSFGYTLLVGVIGNFLMGVTASRLMLSSLSGYKFMRKKSWYGGGAE